MVDAMRGHPEDWTTFESEAAAGGDEVLEPLWGLVAAVREQAMVGHADADIDREEVHDEKDGEVLPRPEQGKKRGDGTNVEEPHCDGRDPVDAALLVLATHAQVLLNLLCDLLDANERAGDCSGSLVDFR